MEKNINMTEGKPLKLLVSFALPLMFGNIFQQLYTVVDTAIVGRGVGMDALAAVGTVDWLNWMFLGIAQGFTQGFSVRMSQKYGEGDKEGLKRAIGQSVKLSVVITVLVTVIGQLGVPFFLQVLRVPAEISGMAELYIRIMLGGFVAMMFFNFCSSVLRSIGDSQTPLKAMMVASVTNIVLDYVAVFILHWGIAGAAAATLFSQCLAGTICAVKIYQSPDLHFGGRHLESDLHMGGNLMKIGAPIAAQNVIIALGGIVVQSVVNGFGTGFIAGFTATNKLYGLLEIAAISYGYAVTTYVGQNYGAGKPERIKNGMNAAVKLSLVTAAAIGVLMIIFGRQITMLFISAEVPELAKVAGDTAYWYLFCMSVSLPVLYLLHVYQAALRGMGNSVISMKSGIVEFCLRVSLSILVGITGFEYGIFGAEVSAWYGAAIFLALSYYRIVHKNTKKCKRFHNRDRKNWKKVIK